MTTGTPAAPSPSPAPAELRTWLIAQARDAGFELAGIAPAVTPPGYPRFLDWLAAGYAGDMGYLDRRREAYEHPAGVFPPVKSVLMLGLVYRSESRQAAGPLHADIASYAWNGADYHAVIRTRLKSLTGALRQTYPAVQTRGIVDTAPLLERDFARLAGLGWQAKNTLLINRQQGSFLFLAALLLSAEATPDAPFELDHCGTCTRCLDACPTQAFPAPRVLDARRCISYLTIELRQQPIPRDLREPLGHWVFGCDICQDVCPWNDKTSDRISAGWKARSDWNPAALLPWFAWTAEEFARQFAGSPLDRPGRAGLLRNAAIVLGNWRSLEAVPALTIGLHDTEPLVRGAAAWALGQISGIEARTALLCREPQENDAVVRDEIAAALLAAVEPAGTTGPAP